MMLLLLAIATLTIGITVVAALDCKEEKIPVSFHAQMSGNGILVKDLIASGSQKLKFETIVSNTGDVYDSTTSNFIAKEMGMYYFEVVIYAKKIKGANPWIHINLMKNTRPIGFIHLETLEEQYYRFGTTQALVVLHKGDSVRVKIKQRRGGSYIIGNGYSYFLGFRVN